jgi:hypothetical protein
MALSKIKLSGSTDGKPIHISGTATGSANTIHTAQSGTSFLDEIWLWVTNRDSSDRTLTIEWGATTDPDGLLCKAVVIPANSGPICIAPGLVLQNSLVVKAFASVTNVLGIHGYVIRAS